MNFKDLNITCSSVFRPKFSEGQGQLDDQYYGYLIPFQIDTYDESIRNISTSVYLIDTYHIERPFNSQKVSEYNNYSNYFLREDKVYKGIPFVTDFYYQHCYKITSIEDLNKRFQFLCDLNDFKPCSESDYYNYNANDRIDLKLWYEGHRFYLVKKNAIEDKTLLINNLICEVENNINIACIHSEYEMERLKTIVEANYDCDFDKDRYNKVVKWYNFISHQILEAENKYKEIFELLRK